MKMKLQYWLASPFTINTAVGLLFWIIFYPGLFSSDSFAANQMAKSGELSNAFTASWAIFVRYFSFFGQYIGLLTLINVLVLIYSTTTLSNTLFSYKVARIASLLLCLTPGVSGIGITLWHDIPMTSGLLLLMASLISSFKGETMTKQTKINLLLGSILITFRPNGVPTLLLASLLSLVFIRTRRLWKSFAIMILVSTFVTLSSSYGALNQPPINKYFSQEWMRNDISCFAASSDEAFFERTTGIKRSLHSKWKSEEACTFLNRFTLSDDEKYASMSFVPTTWLQLLRSEPMFVIKTHAKRNAYLLPVPFFGLPSPPFLHTNIELKDRGIVWKFEEVADEARKYLRIWNYLRALTGWAGLWFMFLFIATIREKTFDLKLLTIFNFSLLSILFVFAPIPDGRYALFTLISGQLVTVGHNLQKLLEKRNPNV
jgi:4-amino-4-deoxy-L-arabinose transferase-like glycosyltransferase